MRLLVLTTEPVTADQLREAVPEDTEPEDAEVMVVAPAIHDDPLHFWMSDADEAIGRAEQVRRESVEGLGEEGVSATGDTGEADPYTAIFSAASTGGKFSVDSPGSCMYITTRTRK